MNRSWIQRSGKPMRKRGRKTNDWIKTRRQLSAEFAEKGITSCELRISPDCKRDSWLSFAHSRKRRFITTPAQLRECVLACTPCHDVLDLKMSHAEMFTAVMRAIEAREVEAEVLMSTTKQEKSWGEFSLSRIAPGEYALLMESDLRVAWIEGTALAEWMLKAVNSYDHLRSQNQKLREACEVALPWVEANTVEACSGHGPNPSQCLECHLRANGQRLANKLRAALKEVE